MISLEYLLVIPSLKLDSRGILCGACRVSMATLALERTGCPVSLGAPAPVWEPQSSAGMHRETGRQRESYLGKENIDRQLMRKRLSLQ